MSDAADRSRDLSEYANAAAQPNQPTPPPPGHALVRPTTGLADRIIGAQAVAVHRDEAKIKQKLTQIAAMAGTDWFYRFPVKKKDGGQDWIEGPSIKLANDVARIFGNNVNEVREVDVGDAWVFYARFTDIETGFSMERAYRQRKTQMSLKTKDADRQLDIAYQIGQSKAIRNCIVNSLQIYADYAFEEARNSLVDKIGRDLPAWRDRTVEGLESIPVEINRVKRLNVTTLKDWLAGDIAQVIAMGKAISDGMATADETFPLIETSSSSATPDQGTVAPHSPTTAETGTSGGEQDAGVVGQSRDPAVAGEIAIVTAYERGQKARADNAPRKAIPGEYRDSTRTREALSWQAGYDGLELPKFPN
jgi:hypothetical protein